MDISIFDTNCIKIKGKHSSLVIDPLTAKSKSKTAADGVVLLSDSDTSAFPNVENYRVIIRGPGEYEVGGIMVSGRKTDNGFIYEILADNLNIVLGKASQISQVLDKIDTCQILLLDADSEISQTVVGTLEPNVLILYGEKTAQALKSLNKENVLPVTKFTLTKDKLAEGMEVIVLNA